MRVPAATGYAVAALAVLTTTCSSDPCPVWAIAERAGVPGGFLEHILRDLRDAGLVRSSRGGRGCGGFRLARPAEEITLAEVVLATSTEHPPATGSSPELANSISAVWRNVDALVEDYLSEITIHDVVERAAEPTRSS